MKFIERSIETHIPFYNKIESVQTDFLKMQEEFSLLSDSIFDMCITINDSTLKNEMVDKILNMDTLVEFDKYSIGIRLYEIENDFSY